MLTPAGSFRHWAEIDYRPVIEAHDPAALIAELPPSARVLEVGCHDGKVACHLARVRSDCVIDAIDINPSSIEGAQRRAAEERLTNTRFEVEDVLRLERRGLYDAIVTIRVLTCFPDAQDWTSLIEAIRGCLREGGIWYAIDYAFDPVNPAYRDRYAAGMKMGWRRGNFEVQAPHFVAHHHTEEELQWIRRIFTDVRVRRFDSRSLNGNPVAMFEVLARRGTA